MEGSADQQKKKRREEREVSCRTEMRERGGITKEDADGTGQ